MSKNDNTISLKHAINKLISTYKWKGKLNEIKLNECWEDVMGPVIAQKTRNIYLSGSTLYVTIDSPALKQELEYSKTLVKDKVNEALQQNAVKTVKFK